MNKRIVIALFLLSIATAAVAELPPAKWWRRPDLASRLELTEEQKQKLDTIFRSAANELIDLRGEVEKQNIALRGELDQSQLNRANIQRIAGRLSEARGKLFERELMMLADMRAVLSEDQWTRLRAGLDRLNAARAQQHQRPMNQRPPGPGPGQRRPRLP